MALVYYGNDILRRKADEVRNINQETIDLVNSMYRIMYKEKGVGLAAPQVNESKKIITIDIKGFKSPKLALINPEVIMKSDEMSSYEEGCLSFPGISKEIIRPAKITVKGTTPDEKEIILDAEGLLSVVLQHEIDHINGIVFIDHLEDHVRKSLHADLKIIKKLSRES